MIAVLATALSVTGPGPGCVEPVRTFHQLDSAVVATVRSLESQPTSFELGCRLGALRMQGGRYHEADSILAGLLAADSTRVDVLLTQAMLRRRQYRFEEAASALDRAEEVGPGNPGLRLLRGRHALDRMDLPSARTIYVDLLDDDPASADALLGLAEIAFWEDRPEDAQRLVEEALSRDPRLPEGQLLLSRLRREAQATAEWRAAVSRAVELDSLFADGHAALATVLRSEGALEDAYGHAQLALDLDPFSREAHSYLGNGGSLSDYDSVPVRPADFGGRVGDLLATGDEHLLARRYREATGPFHEVLTLDSANVVALMGLGSAHFHLGEYEEALGRFNRILVQHPGYGLAHYGISYTLRRMKDRVTVGLDEMRAVFETLDAPEPPALPEVFPDYERLDPELRKIVRLSVAPFSNYLPALALAGATFHLLPFHKLLWQSPHKERTRGTRTFDLRLWDDVKGQGGFHAVGGEEWVRDVRIRRWNVVTHEFAHQVHSMFPDDLRAEVAELFQTAKAERRTLDYYADFNEMEYLAQAAEAFTAEVKYVDQRGTSKHTRGQLRAADPELFAFLERVNARPSYRDVEIRAYRQRGNTLLGSGDVRAAAAVAREGLQQYGDHPDLLDLLARTLRIEGNYAEARRLHGRTIEAFPDAIVGYAGLAEDVVLQSRDHEHALGVLRSAAARRPESAELQMRLASAYFAAGSLDGMDSALDSAQRIEASPNPYAGTADPWVLRARGRMLREDHEGAEQAFRHTLEHINRRNPSAWADLALLQLRTGRVPQGRADLATAMLLDDGDPRVREVAAEFAVHDGDTATALSSLRQNLADDESRLETLIRLSELLDGSDETTSQELAERGLQRVSSPDPVEFVFREGSFVARGFFDDATASRVYTRVADLAEQDGYGNRALQHHRRAVELFPHNFVSGVAVVRLLAEAGRVVEARDELRRLEEIGAPDLYLADATVALESRR